uniref:Endonuclease/exonuclease/phosphatase domain-containing protein n=1 Tax=Octopus bimaculoides TaxID=37653 RepID=A0A0L8FII4_OCTBM
MFNIEIAALSKVRFADECSLKERGAGYTLIWSGKPSYGRRMAGVGLMVRNSITSKLETLPTCHSDHIISICLPLKSKQHLMLFSVYAPTLLADPADKDCFYSDLRRLLSNTPANDKVLILGDFNARAGRDSEAWKGLFGRHRCLLLEFCTEHQLAITNKTYQQKDCLKTTSRHPRSKHWHLLDYVLVRQWDLKDVLHTRVMPSAECHTDHRLVCCKPKLQLKPKPKKKGNTVKKLSIGSLCQEEMKVKFQAELQKKLDESPRTDDTTTDILWENLKSAILKTSEEVLGHTKNDNKDWFDDNDKEIQELLARKRAANQANLAQPTCPVKKATFRRANRCINIMLGN